MIPPRRRLRRAPARRAAPAGRILAPLGLLAGALGLGTAVTAPAGAATGPAPSPTVTVPLSVGVGTPGASWAVVAMGQLRQPSNTFWQLLARPTGSVRWKLATPPGVATNGGLAISVDPHGPLTAGVQPTNLLRYSPLGQTTDGGAQWSAGIVPTGLSPVPDALTGQLGSRVIALVRRRGGQVLTGTGTGSSLTLLATARSLRSPSSSACGVTGLDAVALSITGTPLIGTGCRQGGEVGVFTPVAGGWQLAGVRLGAPLADSATSVLRLTQTASGPAGIVAATGTATRGTASPPGTDLVAVWRSNAGQGWSTSLPLALPRAGTLRATAVGPEGALLVLVAGPGGGQVLEEADGPGHPWLRLPAPPAGTSTVAPVADGSIDAFVADHASLKIYALAPGATSWVALQSMEVPIDYGSSA